MALSTFSEGNSVFLKGSLAIFFYSSVQGVMLPTNALFKSELNSHSCYLEFIHFEND